MSKGMSRNTARSLDIFNELSEHVTLRINSCKTDGHGGNWSESKAHLDYDLWMILQGPVILRSRETVQIAETGDMVLHYPHMHYTANAGTEGCRFIYLHFEFGIGNRFRLLDEFSLAGIIPGEWVRPEAEGFMQAVADYHAQGILSGIRLKGALMILLGKIFKLYGEGRYEGKFNKGPKPSEDEKSRLTALQPVFRHIDSHLHNSIKMKDLAGIAGMSEKYFITFFKKSLGITPGQYIFQLKMNRARDLLYQRKYRIQEIAAMLGYPDPYTFSKAFKKYYNVPPSRFV